MTTELARLLSRRLLIVTGKGGTGKTSVAAALGQLAARRGLETVVIERTAAPAIQRLLEPEPSARTSGREPIECSPHLYALRLDPLDALTEYLELQLRVPMVARALVGSRAFQRLLAATPGWRDLITLGKLWHLETRTREGRPRWDLLIVDAPATGHGLAFLSTPNVIRDTVRMGPLRRHTDWVQALLEDPHKTWVVPITLAEELPVGETLELRENVAQLALSLGPTLVNCIESTATLPELEIARTALDELPEPAAAPLPPIATLRAVVNHRLRRAALQRVQLERLSVAAGFAAIELPLLTGAIRDHADVEVLSRALEAALEAVPGTEP